MRGSHPITKIAFQVLRFAGKLTLALSTMVIGVGGTLYSFEYFPPKVTVCELARYPRLYSGRKVTIESDARGLFGITIEDGMCEAPDAELAVWPAEGYEPPPDVQKMYSEPSAIYTARVRVTGRFDPDATPGCFAPKAAFRATSIELTSPVTTEPIPERNIAGD